MSKPNEKPEEPPKGGMNDKVRVAETVVMHIKPAEEKKDDG